MKNCIICSPWEDWVLRAVYDRQIGRLQSSLTITTVHDTTVHDTTVHDTTVHDTAGEKARQLWQKWSSLTTVAV